MSQRTDLSIYIPSHRPALAAACQQSLKPLNARIWNGAGYPSFSKLVNDCIRDCPSEILLISNDKARAKPKHVDQLLNLLDEGYGLVGLYRFGFFGFKLDLIRQIGFFDERYVSGEYEDSDMIIRLLEANIAYYASEEIPYIYQRSSWNNTKAKAHYEKKWGWTKEHFVRQLPEEDYGYQLQKTNETQWLPWEKSRFVYKPDAARTYSERRVIAL